ncbi:MAG TPA: hypothetical protein VHY22_07650 [Chthoniobacteraceae bacterium]|nr:hypothetical protein [Chthoniobacteraceae bacterium]
MRQPIFPLPALLLLLALPCGAGCHKREQPAAKPLPSIDGLTEVLKHTAEQTLAAPSLASDQVILTAGKADTEATVEAVLKGVSDAGGVGIRSTNSQGYVSILATVPENNAEAFKAALHHVKVSLDVPSKETRLVEIVIEPPTPSPTP